MKFIQLAKSLQEKLEQIYLIEGEDAYFRDHAVSAVRDACAITLPMLNDVRYEGETLKGEALSAFTGELRTLPFIDGKRFVRVYEFHPTEREWENVLKAYAEKPCPSTVLAIVNAGKKANTADLKRKGGIVYVDCSRESEETLSRWLFGMMRRAGLEADPDAVSLMVRYCAQDAARIKTETEKLALLLGKGGRVTRGEVEEYVAKDVEYKIYELTQAASRKSFSAFSEILDDLMKKGCDENAVLSMLTAHYRTLCEIAGMRGTDAEIGKALGVKPYVVQKSRETARRFGADGVKEQYRVLYALSCGAKSGIYTKSGALTAAIAKIFFG